MDSTGQRGDPHLERMQEEKRRGRVKAGVAEMGAILERKETSGKELRFFEAKFASHKTRTRL